MSLRFRFVLAISLCGLLDGAARPALAQSASKDAPGKATPNRDPRLTDSDGYWWYWNKNDTWSLYTRRGWLPYRTVLSEYAGTSSGAESGLSRGRRVEVPGARKRHLGAGTRSTIAAAPATVPASSPPQPTLPSAPNQPRPTGQSPIAANPPMASPSTGESGNPTAPTTLQFMLQGSGNTLGTGPGSAFGADATTGWFGSNRFSNPIAPNQPVGALQSPFAINPPMVGPNRGAAGNPAMPPPGPQLGVNGLPNGR